VYDVNLYIIINFIRPCCTIINTQIMNTVITFGMASHTSFYRAIFVVVN